MEEKITVEISEDGEIHAETFGMQGTECTQELDRLMKGLATVRERHRKDDYYKEKVKGSAHSGVRNDQR